VLPVAQRSCLGCHNDDAPTFSMARYSDELASRAKLIAEYTEMRVMPPWKPSSDCNHYQGERTLTAEEIALFAAWSEGGALEGDPADAPVVEEPRGLERVDASLAMSEPYLPAPDPGAEDDLRCFVYDPQLTSDRYMVGYEVRPGEPRVVHHAVLSIADAAEADVLDAADEGPGYDCFGGTMAPSAVVVAGWVPGMRANLYPTGTAIPLAADKRLILQIHYNTRRAGPLPDSTSVDLQLADAPPTDPAAIVGMFNTEFAVPPLTDAFTSEIVVPVPQAGRLWAALPHMHLLGQRIRVDLLRADNSSTCVIDIPDWDFDWQQLYFLQQPLQVKPGDSVRLSCTWNNDTDSVVTWGEGTGEEMCLSYFYATQ
jgi:hypothetical protein